MPNSSVSSRSQPVPMPKRNRPSLKWSRVAISFGQQDRIAFRHEANAGTQFERGRYRRSPSERNERIDAFVVHLRDCSVGGSRPGRLGAGGDGRVFWNPKRFEPVSFASLRQLGDVDGRLGDKHRDANIHGR